MLSTAVLPEEWRRLVIERLAPFDPEKIIVFGSRARGEARSDSDVDLLVVLENVDGRRRDLGHALDGVPFANDLVLATPATIEQRGDAVGMVYRRALREGVIIYGMDDRDAQTWLRYAEEDLEAAEAFSGRPGFAPRVACYQAQQAAEKALKAVLVAEGRDPVLTHHLGVLQDLVAPGTRVASLKVDLVALSRWHIQGRYPGDWGEATRDDALAAIGVARSVVEAAREDVGS